MTEKPPTSIQWLSISDEVLQRLEAQLQHIASILPTVFKPWLPQSRELRSFLEVAFWASLRSNEDRPTRVRIALVPRDRAPQAFAFAAPTVFNESEIAKLSHVVPPQGSLLVSSENDVLQIWGFTNASPVAEGVVLEIAGPGLVRINVHMLRPYAVFRGGTVFFLEGAAPVALPDYLRRVMRKKLPAEDMIALHQAWHECIVLGVLARMILEQGHGGTILIVPDVDGDWLRSIEPFAYRLATADATAQEWIRSRLKEGQTYGDALTRIASAPLSNEDKAALFAALSTQPWLPHDAVGHIAPLALCDGAIVMTADLRLVGFGAKIKTHGNVDAALCRLEPTPGLQQLKPCALEDFGGTRHQSAARFVAENKNAVAIIVSHDRRMSVVSWNDENKCLIGVQHAEWWT